MKSPAPERVEFLGFWFDPLEASAARDAIVESSRNRKFSFVVTPNVDHVVKLHHTKNPVIESAYSAASLCICDSRILSRLASLSGLDLPPVPGSDVTRDLLQTDLPSCRVAVVGGDERLHRKLAALFPRFEWGFHMPPMGVRTNAAARDAIATFVNAFQADVTLFAIGAPQSEIVCAEIMTRGQARGVALCIGASLEFLTGTKRRAPRWMQTAGLEWLFRLISEPRRLSRRYLLEGPRIFRIWRRWRRLNADRARSGSIPSGGV